MYGAFEYAKCWKIILINEETNFEKSYEIFWKAEHLIGKYTSDIGYSDRIFQFDSVEFFKLCKQILDDNHIKYELKYPITLNY